jgi:phage gp45-like
MDDSRIIRFGVIHEESADKGPYKLTKVMADGKVMDLEVIDVAGAEGSPLKDSRVLIFTPDGDDGKAFGIAYGPPVKDRTDGQKPGEATYKNHKRGQRIKLDDDGNVVIDGAKNVKITTAENVEIKATNLKVEGKFQLKGDMSQEGSIESTGSHKASAHI